MPYTKDKQGKFVCPKAKDKVSSKAAKRCLMRAIMQHSSDVVSTIRKLQALPTHVANMSPRAYRKACADGILSRAVVPDVMVNYMIFEACKTYPNVFLSSDVDLVNKAIHSLIQALLSAVADLNAASLKDTLWCATFAAADKAIQSVKCYSAVAVVEPYGVAASLEVNLESGHTCDSLYHTQQQCSSEPCATKLPNKATNCHGIEKTHLPVLQEVFQQIQSELLHPCTMDVYADQHTTVCPTYAEPPNHPFVIDDKVDGNSVFWIHCPKSLRAEYIARYKKLKLACPTVSAVLLMPYKLPSHQLGITKGMQLLHVYSTGTELFSDPKTGKAVKCRCTFALWLDAPKHPEPTPVPVSCETDTEHYDVQAATSDASVPRRHRMQSLVQVVVPSRLGHPAQVRALFDTGAAGGNYICKKLCQRLGIKLTPATHPISVTGIGQGADQATQTCKLTVRMSGLSDHITFYAVDLPTSFDH